MNSSNVTKPVSRIMTVSPSSNALAGGHEGEQETHRGHAQQEQTGQPDTQFHRASSDEYRRNKLRAGTRASWNIDSGAPSRAAASAQAPPGSWRRRTRRTTSY